MISPEFIISLSQLDHWICLYLWAFARISGTLIVMPVMSEFLPVKHRLLLSCLLVLSIFNILETTTTPVPPFSAQSIFILIGEFITGVALGFIPALFMSLFAMAGNIISMQMGLGMAQINDPVSGTVIPVISQFYSLCALLLLFACNGHMVLIVTLLKSFQMLPLGSFLTVYANLYEIVTLTSQIWSSALLLALPAIFLLLIMSIALGMMSRVAPQLNLMSIGFPASLLFSWFVLSITSQSFSDTALRLIQEMLITTTHFIQT